MKLISRSVAEQVKRGLREACPDAVIIDSFLNPAGLASVLSRCALNFHPCAYDAYGMTIVEAAAFGARQRTLLK
eukprot:4583662-Pleurochrysis_carterae.AAC.2